MKCQILVIVAFCMHNILFKLYYIINISHKHFVYLTKVKAFFEYCKYSLNVDQNNYNQALISLIK